jgi:hypothetical protein
MSDSTPTLTINTSAPITVTSGTGNGIGAGLVYGSTPYISSTVTGETIYANVLCFITVPGAIENSRFEVGTHKICYPLKTLHGICISTDYTTDDDSSLWYIEFEIEHCGHDTEFTEFIMGDSPDLPGRGSISIPKSGVGDPE